MSQSSFITAMLAAGFVLYLAANNRLSTYTAVLWGATEAPLPSLTPTGTAGGSAYVPGIAPNEIPGLDVGGTGEVFDGNPDLPQLPDMSGTIIDAAPLLLEAL